MVANESFPTCSHCQKPIRRPGQRWCDACPPATIEEMCDRAQLWAEYHYRLPAKDGQRVLTGEHTNIRDAMRALRAVSGPKEPTTLRAESLCEAQDWMVARGLSRSVINKHISRLRMVAKWAAQPPRRWLPADVTTDLKLVPPLKRGRSEAVDYPEVEPVSWDAVLSTMAIIPKRQRHLYSLIELQWLTGMRPGEAVRMERSEISIETIPMPGGPQEVMVYKPTWHKTKHHGFDRNIFLSPEARRIVEDRLRQVKGEKLWPYTTNSYREAIIRLCRNHDQVHWTPNQIRHSFATRMRDTSGLDVVQVLMGHRHKKTTEIYAQPNCTAAIEAIFKFA